MLAPADAASANNRREHDGRDVGRSVGDSQPGSLNTPSIIRDAVICHLADRVQGRAKQPHQWDLTSRPAAETLLPPHFARRAEQPAADLVRGVPPCDRRQRVPTTSHRRKDALLVALRWRPSYAALLYLSPPKIERSLTYSAT